MLLAKCIIQQNWSNTLALLQGLMRFGERGLGRRESDLQLLKGNLKGLLFISKSLGVLNDENL